MRYKLARAFGVLALVLLLCPLGACSGQQQEEGDLEATQEYDQQGYDQETTEGTDTQGYDNTETGYDTEDTGYDETTGYDDTDTAGYDTESTELENPNLSETANTETATENDLAEIIEELNNQATAATDTAIEDTVPAMDTAGMDPTMAGMEGTAGAVPLDPGTGGVGGAPVASAGSAPAEATFPFQPGGTPAGQGLPELGSKMPYIVQKGDSLAGIAQTIYGTTSKWREMADLSGLENPSRIYPGDLVYYTLSEDAIPFAQQYENLPRSEEIVQQGDTLITISQRVYGSREGWKSIWRHNGNIDNPDTLVTGSVVYYVNTSNLSASVKQARKEFAKQLAEYKAIQAERKAALELAQNQIKESVKSETVEITDYTVACAQMISDVTVPVHHNAEESAKVLKEIARISEVALI